VRRSGIRRGVTGRERGGVIGGGCGGYDAIDIESDVSIVVVVTTGLTGRAAGAVYSTVESVTAGGAVNDTAAHEMSSAIFALRGEGEAVRAGRPTSIAVAVADPTVHSVEDWRRVPDAIFFGLVPALDRNAVAHGPAAGVNRFVSDTHVHGGGRGAFNLNVFDLVLPPVVTRVNI
jgi:hypothetical protein